MILLAFPHGPRAAELCDLRWDQVEWTARAAYLSRRPSSMQGPRADSRNYENQNDGPRSDNMLRREAE
jgi:hypothetical protein